MGEVVKCGACKWATHKECSRRQKEAILLRIKLPCMQPSDLLNDPRR